MLLAGFDAGNPNRSEPRSTRAATLALLSHCDAVHDPERDVHLCNAHYREVVRMPVHSPVLISGYQPHKISAIALCATLMVVGLLHCSNGYAQATPNPLSSFMDQLKQRLQQATQGRQGASGSGGNSAPTTVIDKIRLRNILPEYDPDESIAEQYPHVAFTVLKSPSHWMSPPVAFSGCWTLSALVWSNAQSSKQVGPFDWCMPADQQIRLGPMAVYGLPTASYLDIYHHATTNIHRTTGPKPPNSINSGRY